MMALVFYFWIFQALCKYKNEQVKAMISTLKEMIGLKTTRNKQGQYYVIIFVCVIYLLFLIRLSGLLGVMAAPAIMPFACTDNEAMFSTTESMIK